jgi:hypothetical protein
MADISMCKGEDCPERLKTNCYRYRAVPGEYQQAYFVGSPYEPKKNTCVYFWEIQLGDRLRDLNDIQ